MASARCALEVDLFRGDALVDGDNDPRLDDLLLVGPAIGGLGFTGSFHGCSELVG